MLMSQSLMKFAAIEARLPELVALCKNELHAEEVWLFGSRARGDSHSESDWDLLAVVRDNAPDVIMDPVKVWETRRKSGVNADLLAVRKFDFDDAQDSVTTLAYAARNEGIRLDI